MSMAQGPQLENDQNAFEWTYIYVQRLVLLCLQRWLHRFLGLFACHSAVPSWLPRGSPLSHPSKMPEIVNSTGE